MSEGRVSARLADDGALELVIDRPDAGNVLTGAMTAALTDALRALPETARFVVLRGEGGDFCAGRESPMPPAGAQPTVAEIRARVAEPVLDFYQTVRDTPVPIIAAVRGRALGVGCALAGLADYALADDTARLGIPEMDRDIPPLLVMTALAERLPRAALARLVLSRQPVGAVAAERMGLIAERVTAGRLDGRLTELRAGLARNSRTALSTVKRFLNAAPQMGFASLRELAAAANSGAVSERFHGRGD